MATSIIGRKTFPAAAAAAAVFTANNTSNFDGRWIRDLSSKAICEAISSNSETSKRYIRPSSNMFLFQESGVRETVLRKRMTSIGRFSMKSESAENPSIPTFFLALSGHKKTNQDSIVHGSPNKFTLSDFESAWLDKDMPNRHPRFHSIVSPQDDRYFEEIHHIKPDSKEYSVIKAELDRHVSETMHFSVYRDDLRYRIEHMLTSLIEVKDKLWEVNISNGPLGSSGAISKAKIETMVREIPDSYQPTGLGSEGDDFQRRKYGAHKLWSETAHKVTPMESVLLFRSHHALADGASIMAALSDLCDESEEIRAEVEKAMRKWRQNGKKGSSIRHLLRRLARYLKVIIWFTLGTLQALIYQSYLQLTTDRNPFDAVKVQAEKNGLMVTGRSISWCDAAPLEEAKQICKTIGKVTGTSITINDLFVSCVTSAIVRQLYEHQKVIAPFSPNKIAPHINVVIPVHLRGGVVLPGESVGNRIGAFVTRCPGGTGRTHVEGEVHQCPTIRLVQVNKSLSYSKNSPAPLISHYFAKFCSDYLKESWTQWLFRRANANACAVVSNNRGFHKKIHINGMAVESAHGFLPLPPGIPIGVVVQSYAGGISLSVTAEKWAVPDADSFLLWIMEEYDRLHRASKFEKAI